MTDHDRSATHEHGGVRGAVDKVLGKDHDEQRSFLEKGAGASNASAAAGGPPTRRTRDEDGAYAKQADKPLGQGEKPDQLSGQRAEDRQESLIDESVEETFPASDPATPKRIT